MPDRSSSVMSATGGSSQIVEEHSVICVLYSLNGILFVVENHLVDGWMGQNGMSEESSNILGGYDDIVSMHFVSRPIRS